MATWSAMQVRQHVSGVLKLCDEKEAEMFAELGMTGSVYLRKNTVGKWTEIAREAEVKLAYETRVLLAEDVERLSMNMKSAGKKKRKFITDSYR